MLERSKIIRMMHFAARLALIGLVTMLTVIMVLPFSDVSFARPPVQEPDTGSGGEEPIFQASTYTAADGTSTIRSQETTLGSSYFGSHGTAEGLEVTPDGLRLAPGMTNGTYTSEPLASPLGVTTDLVPSWRVTLPPGAQVKLETRLSSDGTAWSGWAENPVAFYPVRDNEYGGTLVWIGSRGPVFVQIRLTLSAPSAESPTLHYLTLVFSDASQGPSDAAIAAQMPPEAAIEVCPAERPPVVSRTQWGSPEGQGSPRWPAGKTEVTHVVIHHTATPSTFEEWNRRSPYYQISDWATVVRAVWNYHANTLRWGDIGYNYVIDPNGTVYEGRAGGQDGQYDIVGAHDGKNRHSMGIGFIGCYGNCESLGLQNANPPHAMMNKGVELMAWKVGQKGLDPHGQAYYHGRLTPNIAGGRDVTATHSPGDNLYFNWLPWIRDAVRDRVQCQPSYACQIADITFDKAVYNLYDTINLIAKVADHNGAPLGGAKVTAAVSVQSFASTANSSFELEDKTGEYHGAFTDTAMSGTYVFEVTAEHANFQTCSLSKSVDVIHGPCTITTRAEPSTLTTPGGLVNLIANVTLDGQDVTNANVIAHIARPDSSFAEITLPWQSGNTYQQAYYDTHVQGQYSFFVTASGEGFEQCSADGSFSVTSLPDAAVSIHPSSVQIPLCGVSQKTEVRIRDVTNLHAFSFRLSFDPDIVRVADADPDTPGVQILLGDVFSSKAHLVAANNVDHVNGVIDFAVTLVGAETVSGDAILTEINWEPCQVGSTALTLSEVNLAGPNGIEITPQISHGFAEVLHGCDGIWGQVYLQGRTDHSGVTVTDGQGQQIQTEADGSFTIASSDVISARFPGYLSAEADVHALLAQTDVTANVDSTDLGSITLLAGDINGDNIINIFDLAYMASNYQSVDPLADLNADGVVNIQDLALAASNYLQEGPLTSWQ